MRLDGASSGQATGTSGVAVTRSLDESTSRLTLGCSQRARCVTAFQVALPSRRGPRG